MLKMEKTFIPIDAYDVMCEMECLTNLMQLLMDWFEEYSCSDKTAQDKDAFLSRAESYYLLAGQINGEINDLRERAKLTDEAYPDKKAKLLECVKAIADNL